VFSIKNLIFLLNAAFFANHDYKNSST